MIIIGANLVLLVFLAFAYPHLMVSPGPLLPGHAELTTDCFACHAPLRGASSERCVACHAMGDIGLRTTKGVTIAQRTVKSSFHQDLIEQDCIACHSDHRAPRLTQRSRKPFSHALLRTEVQQRCESCHAVPSDHVHRDLNAPNCAQCHESQRWMPATFDHAMLTKAVQANCESCHKAPSDTLHRQLRGQCGQCHSQQKWKPATLEHDKLFVLDRDHKTECVTCHTNDDYSRYTCYGCHEHQPSKIRSKHLKEGISSFENCVECHRSAEEEPRKKGTDGKQKKRD